VVFIVLKGLAFQAIREINVDMRKTKDKKIYSYQGISVLAANAVNAPEWLSGYTMSVEKGAYDMSFSFTGVVYYSDTATTDGHTTLL